MTMNCPKNGMLITALVYAKKRNKSNGGSNLLHRKRSQKPPVINSDNCRRLLKVSQVTAQQNSYSSQPVVASSQVTAQHYKEVQG